MMNTQEGIVAVDVSSSMSTGAILGWTGDKYSPAIGVASEAFDGDGTTKTFDLAQDDVIHGTVSVAVGGTAQTEGTDYTVDYAGGAVTFGTAPASGTGNIVVDYEYFAYDPAVVLMEDVVASQDPAYALCLLSGISYATTDNEDVRARLKNNGIVVVDQASA